METILLYNSYGSENILGVGSVVLIVIAILFIAFGILQTVLFFKLWRMTNDIRKIEVNIRDIKYRYCPKIASGLMRKLLILGQKEKAKEIIIDNFFNKLSDGNDFDNEKKVLEQNFSRIGEVLPKELKDLTAESYYKTV
jgi:hypothetical protein